MKVPAEIKKKSLMVVEHTLEESTDLQDIWQVGNYAIGIRWKDGHDNGIYTFDFFV